MFQTLVRMALLLACSVSLSSIISHAATPDPHESVGSQVSKSKLTYAHVEYHLARCDDGHMESCVDAAGHFDRGDLSAADPVRARALFDKACKGGSANGCSAVAFAMSKVDGDHAGAAVLYDRACLAGSGYACLNLVLLAIRMPELGIAGAKDGRLLRQSCALDYAKGCTALGRWLSFNQRDLAGFQEAAKHFSLSCDLGDGEGCGELGDRIAMNPRRSDELPQALAFYQRGCALGWGEACSDGQRLADMGIVAAALP